MILSCTGYYSSFFSVLKKLKLISLFNSVRSNNNRSRDDYY